MVKPLTEKEESFAQAFMFHKEQLIEAYRHSKYSQNLNAAQMSVQANKLFKKPSINLRITELQQKASKIADEKFTISVEWRLRALKDVYEAGMGTYRDAQENERKENLSAAKGAIETMNTMLGVTDDGDDKGEPLTIQFNVSPAVGNVKVTNA